MRLFPILTAVLVCAFTYMFIMERDTLRGYAGVVPAQAQEAPAIVAIEDKPPVSVLVRKSTAQPVSRGIILRGNTEAGRNVDVKAETSGQVVSQPLRRGAVVTEGDVLCELDPGTRQASLAEARARLAEAEANEKASAQLVQKGFASETQAISRVAALQSAQAAVERAERELEQLTLTAPFSGILESDTAEFGALLQPGQSCAVVISLDQIKLVGFATEEQVQRINLGARAGARLVGGETVVGELTFISRRADPLTRTFRVEVTVPNPDLAIRDGSTAEIFVALDGDTGHLLPQSALTLDDTGRLGVRVVEDGKAKFMGVSIINDSAEGVWLSGLPPQVEVIVVGQEYVVTGRRVTVTYQEDQS